MKNPKDCIGFYVDKLLRLEKKMRTRQNRIEFYLNDREYAKLDRAVKRSGLTKSTYLRHLVNNRIPQDQPPKEYWDFLEEARGISKHIRDIAYTANATGNIDASRYDYFCEEVRNLYMKLFEMTLSPRKWAEMS